MDLKKTTISENEDLDEGHGSKTLPLPVHENLSSLNYADNFDGKLVYDKKCATYTFLDDANVVCLHYDKARQAIFFNGRKVTDLTAYKNLPRFLESFKKALLNHKIQPKFLRSFDLEISKIFEASLTEEDTLSHEQDTKDHHS